MVQNQSDPVREPDDKGLKEEEVCGFANSLEWTFKNWCRISPAQAGRPPKPEARGTQSGSDEEESDEGEAYDFTGDREAYDFTELEE